MSLWAWAAVVLAGCSARDDRVPVFPVQGRVTVAGAAPEGALVVFHPLAGRGNQGPRPMGRVKKNGSFELTTYEADDGAPAGAYVATIQWNPLIKRGGEDVAGPNKAPRGYADREKSPWRVDVTRGENLLPPLAIGK